MNNYPTYLKVLETKQLLEHVFNKERFNQIDRFIKTGDNKNLLLIYNQDIEELKYELNKIDYNDISIRKVHDYYVIEYNELCLILLRG